MSRLIDADALIDDCKKYLNKLNPSRDGKECTRIHWLIGVLSNAPTIESERKKGKWIKNPEYIGDDISGFIDNHFSCSECKKEAEINSWGFYILSDFCPNCGADMREGE